ncbi:MULTISPECIES: serine hydrolase [unclassified Enterococcus]|uniref:serine hydrolase n=1 Tax=unclassified Enterococcus TaxID=2608891 RepID=UPI0015531FFC|nr:MULTISPECIES: serine hydrolase [unclassified Enterococcus]MBS7578126.1 serine hydrolase [Enterococcus sp. MMGLQ5-2]MBS7585386.1 serine hydrolase [Enterococcus sp. MMGLQ5-1]NPD13243.1 serine hydrolase [Enterococcus sp. MMGLQ5-1]NPD37957.1 serine hydrolase [Enterococcus sp. MMGLQ5-2]
MSKKILHLFILVACFFQFENVVSTTNATQDNIQDYYQKLVGKTAVKTDYGVLGVVKTVTTTNDQVIVVLNTGDEIPATDQTVKYNQLDSDFKFKFSTGDNIWLSEASQAYSDSSLAQQSGNLASNQKITIQASGYNQLGEPYYQTDKGYLSAQGQFQLIQASEADYYFDNPNQVLVAGDTAIYRDSLRLQKDETITTQAVLEIAKVTLAKDGIPVLQLSDGRFISANRKNAQFITNQYQNYWTTLPEAVINLTAETKTVSQLNQNTTDAEAPIKKGTIIPISELSVDKQGIPYFKTVAGDYIKAEKNLEAIKSNATDNFTINPNYLQTAKKIMAYSDENLSQNAKEINKNSLVEIEAIVINQNQRPVLKTKDNLYLSAETKSYKIITDYKIYQVQQLLNQKYNDANLGVYVQRASGGEIASINSSQEVHAASTGKLPEIYYTQKLINEGQLKLSDQWLYTADVNSWQGAYETAGAGVISKTADNKQYSVQSILEKTCQSSDNVGANFLGYYATQKYNTDFQNTINQIVGFKWEVAAKKTTAERNAKIMLALYQLGGEAIDYLSHTDFDNQRISKNIDVQVAHKIGDAYDYRHDVGIIYANQPFVLSITTTNNTDYDVISNIADDIYSIMK